MEKAIGSQIVRIKNGRAIVKIWSKEVDDFGFPYGKAKISYDVHEFRDGEIGRRIMGFVTGRAASKFLSEGV